MFYRRAPVAEQDNFPKFHVGKFYFGHIPSIISGIDHTGGGSAHRFAVAVYHGRGGGNFLGIVFSLRLAQVVSTGE